MVKRISGKRNLPESERVAAALDDLLRGIEATEVPPNIVELAETLQRRIDEAEKEKR